jgi:hypothetical protein
MDIKLIILLAVAIAIIFLMMNEMNTLRGDIDKKMNELNNRITVYNEDTKNSFKKETKDMTVKFKTYSADMIKELRTMNNIENQAITHMSDQFAEGDSIDRFGLPHLSDVNPRRDISRRQNHNLNQHQIQRARQRHGFTRRYDECGHIVNISNVQLKSHPRKNTENDGEEFYMSPVSDEFKLKESGKVLPSANGDTYTEETNESENEDNNEVDEEDDGLNDLDDLDFEAYGNENELCEDGDDGEVCEDDEEGDEDEDGEVCEDDEEGEEGDEDEEGGEGDGDEDEEGDGDEDDEVCEENEDGDDEVCEDKKKKSESYKKIRTSLEEDTENELSQDITFGSTNKGTKILVKSVSKKKNLNNDNLSIATEDDEFKLKSISGYSKNDLIAIASQRNIILADKPTKTIIYNKIKEMLV